MTGRKLVLLIAAAVFLVLGLGGFYRLIFGFPIWIGNGHLGHVASYLVFVICIAASIVLIRFSKSVQ